MPRYRRIIAPDSTQHIISRFMNREFRLDGAGVRAEYLARLGRAVARTDWQAISFGLMSNHTHQALVAGNMAARELMHPLNTGFARWMNATENRLGPVFADRYRNVTCDAEYVSALIAYIHNNPVRAFVVRSAEQSRWTSHLDYIGEREPPPWLNVELGLARCGFSSTGNGRAAFHDYVCAQGGLERDALVSGGGLDAKRAQVRQRMGAPVEISSPTISASSEGLRCEVMRLNEVPLRPRMELSTEDVVLRVAGAIGMRQSALARRTKMRRAVYGRRLALLVWVSELGLPLGAMARALGLSSSTASYHLQRGMGSEPELLAARRLALSFVPVVDGRVRIA